MGVHDKFEKNSLLFLNDTPQSNIPVSEIEMAKEVYFAEGGTITMVNTVANAYCYFTVSNNPISTMKEMVR